MASRQSSCVLPSTTEIPPIYKLDYDILWFIFSLNASIDPPIESDTSVRSESPQSSVFDTTLCLSQVCRIWREVILGSPTIWGDVLQVDRLSEWTEEGRREIMKRTGDAALSLKGDLGGSPESFLFFVRILDSELWRIRRIDVRIGCDYEYSRAWKELFRRPAPRLQSFRVSFHFHYGGRRTIGTEGEFLFGGEAPALQELQAKNIKLDLRAPWAGQLRSLLLVSCEQRADDVLEALQAMPLLEYLDLKIAGRTPSPSPAEQSLHLPKLEQLSLSSSLGINLAFAYAIDPSKSCTLAWTSKLTPADVLTLQDIALLRSILGRYSRMYFATRRIESVAIRPDFQNFQFLASPDNSFEALSHVGLQPFCFDFASRIYGAGTVPLLLQSVLVNDLSSVTAFQFHPGFYSDMPPNVHDVVRSLVNVVDVDISERGLGVLFESSKSRILFPSLQRLTIRLTSPPDSKNVSGVLDFLTSRRNLGCSVFELRLAVDGEASLRHHPYPLGDWHILDVIKGMKITWDYAGFRYEYVCGSGYPEQLIFSSGQGDDCEFTFY